jgi:hypothetical protein
MQNEKYLQVSMVIYSPNYIITIRVEIVLKNGARNIYIQVDLEKLPYIVSLIAKQTSPPNSH